ncbi:class I SAM-dependent methyltransferase [Aurantimonas sp. C2-6-R+9]|uniref:class I SAM-dependent methyltransferase n=1 Tax=unclassified Aurantimonas TaxID=2638230 RepID=UPI002E19F0E4|nr:class I SAM-dependent methyltransferase [Aurantimonas sp. C2-6-R+9]
MDRWVETIKLSVRRCDVCGHHWYEEQPESDQLAAMYEAHRPVFPEAATRDPSPAMITQMRRLLRLVERLRPCRGATPRLLDYGSGYGRWARAAQSVGFDVVAFEPSLNRGAEKAESAVAFDVVHELNALRERRFDAVNLEQVLEHIPTPCETLSGLLELAAPGAVLRIATPNVLRCPEGDRLYATWPYDGKRAHTLAPFEHVNGFTPRSLQAVVNRAGWTRVSDKAAIFSNPTHALRRLAGLAVPSLGQTMIYAVPRR